MAKVVLMKRVDDNEPNAWYSEFEKSLAQPRRFKRFQISEISAVDKPAQEGARKQ
jgi:hypothetical protein